MNLPIKVRWSAFLSTNGISAGRPVVIRGQVAAVYHLLLYGIYNAYIVNRGESINTKCMDLSMILSIRDLHINIYQVFFNKFNTILVLYYD